MLLATKIVILVLAGAGIDGAVQTKNYQQAGAASPKRGQRGLIDETPTEGVREVNRGQRQMGYNYPGGDGYNYAAVGADGVAQVVVKLDLSLLLERLNKVPELQQMVINLIQKVDTLIYDIQGGDGGGGNGLSSQIIALEQSILARIEQQDVQINLLYQLMQQSQGELGTINQEISQIHMIVQGIVGGGSGGSCAQETQIIQNIGQQMMNTLTRVLELVEQSNKGPGSGTIKTILELVQETYVLLQQCTTVIEQIGQQVSRGAQCPLNTGSDTEKQILQEMSLVINLIENIPQKILVFLQNLGFLEGSNGALIQYVQQIMQISETVRNDIVTVRDTLGRCIDELRRYFAESQKSLVAVKKVVTETTEIVQSSAAAAISASRSLRCPTKNQKPDLDD